MARSSVQKGAKRARAVAGRARQQKKKIMPALRPTPARPKLLVLKPGRRRRKLGFARAGLAKAAVFAILAFGPQGCSNLKYSDLHRLAEENAVKAGSRAAGIVPGGKNVGRAVSEKVAGIVLGENPAKVIGDAKAGAKIELSSTGRASSTGFWFKEIGLSPAKPADKPQIEFVERVASKTRLFPEEVVLVLGANAPYSVKHMEEKVKTMRLFLANTSLQLSALEADVERIRPKLGKRDKILGRIKSLYKDRDRVAIEYVALQTILELSQLDYAAFNAVKESVLKNFNQGACRRMLDILE